MYVWSGQGLGAWSWDVCGYRICGAWSLGVGAWSCDMCMVGCHGGLEYNQGVGRGQQYVPKAWPLVWGVQLKGVTSWREPCPLVQGTSDFLDPALGSLSPQL